MTEDRQGAGLERLGPGMTRSESEPMETTDRPRGRKVFLDIGAHIGETLECVVSQKWAFERIFCFEPSPNCWDSLKGLSDERVEILPFGLWKDDAVLPLYNEGKVGASMSPDKDGSQSEAPCSFRDIAAWFEENIRDSDRLYVKVNVEGVEVDLIDRLAETGQLSRIDHLLVHFDVRKIPRLRHKEGRARKVLDAAGVQYHSAEDILFGGVARGTTNWLKWCEAPGWYRDIRYRTIAGVVGKARVHLYPFKVAYRRRRTRDTLVS